MLKGPTGRQYFAHTRLGCGPEQWEPLEVHLRQVAEGATKGRDPGQGAADFTGKFASAEWGRVLGLWHDLGKYSGEFQAYLRASSNEQTAEADIHVAEIRGRVDHATAGAQHAVQRHGSVGRLLAYAIAGHHGGLPDNVDRSTGGHSGLEDRLKKQIADYSAAPSSLLEMPAPVLPPFEWIRDDRQLSFQAATFVRMLFSCLVDADFLATESFMQPERAAVRETSPPDMRSLADEFNRHLAQFDVAPPTPVNVHRRRVLHACRDAAALPPGLFDLTVPTGGGKTLSSLAFALRHAIAHSLDRVIYAIPFTSIIEQNTDVFRRALGPLAEHVLEHHSNLDPQRETERSRLAAENWDAPLVVTTNVQLLESLFANRTSACRKLHRIARSVIVLDEAQALPVELLTPTLAMLQELVRNYGCSIVLCTATQPALLRREDFSIGFERVRPIIADTGPLFASLRRVEVSVLGPLDNPPLVEKLARHGQVLCVVNTRRHAAELFASLRDCVGQAGDLEPGIYHLSALMCPAHRRNVLKAVRQRLKNRQACRVVSTQLIEAGVDVDFPVVYRAMAGLDAIAQAAGRCNREGTLVDDAGRPRLGEVYVFEPGQDTGGLPAMFRAGAGHTREILPEHAGNLLAPPAIEAYFRLHYWQKGGQDGQDWDKSGVMKCFERQGTHLQFREAAQNYRLIQDEQTTIIVPFDELAQRLIRQLQAMPEPAGRLFLRQLQPYTVSVRERELQRLYSNQVLLEAHGLWVLANQDAYDRDLGLTMDTAGLGPESLISCPPDRG
ncbi:MAG: CRISPR-associated helicase Cas3' [Phycisphaeraceae bacterium]|nr:CRISPR-associated helicase Cas3' [Phycisphaeraceae bacterium]